MRLDGPVDGTKHVVVAGGAGFLGSHLCDALVASGRSVICIDNLLTGNLRNIEQLLGTPRFRLIEHDICAPLTIREEVAAVYNLACAASPLQYQADPVHTTRTCVLGTLNLLGLAEERGARLLQASTSEVYGDPQQHPQREDYVGHVNCTGPRACYDEGKRAAESLCFDFARAGRADVRVARIFNTYGPRMQPDDGRIVSNFVVQALAGKALTVYGDGSQTRSFCYVSDLIAGLTRLMDLQQDPGGPVNLGNPAEFTVLELAKLVARMTDTPENIAFRPLPADDPRRRRPDIARARTLLRWTPRVGLKAGLARTIAYFRAVRAGKDGRCEGRPLVAAE